MQTHFLLQEIADAQLSPTLPRITLKTSHSRTTPSLHAGTAPLAAFLAAVWRAARAASIPRHHVLRATQPAGICVKLETRCTHSWPRNETIARDLSRLSYNTANGSQAGT